MKTYLIFLLFLSVFLSADLPYWAGRKPVPLLPGCKFYKLERTQLDPTFSVSFTYTTCENTIKTLSLEPDGEGTLLPEAYVCSPTTPEMFQFPPPGGPIGNIGKVTQVGDSCGVINIGPVDCGASGISAAFLVDNTASMVGAINSMKASLLTYSNAIVSKSNNHYQLAVATVNDPEYITGVLNFAYQNKNSFETAVNSLSIGAAGGDAPEPWEKAIVRTATNNPPLLGSMESGSMAKMIFLVTDAPAKYRDWYANAIDVCKANGVKIMAVQAGGYAPTTKDLKEIAEKTGGVYVYGSAGAAIITAINEMCLN